MLFNLSGVICHKLAENINKILTFKMICHTLGAGFVSDTNPADFLWLVGALQASTVDSVAHVGALFQQHIDAGRWIVAPHNFWTLPHEFSALKVGIVVFFFPYPAENARSLPPRAACESRLRVLSACVSMAGLQRLRANHLLRHRIHERAMRSTRTHALTRTHAHLHATGQV